MCSVWDISYEQSIDDFLKKVFTLMALASINIQEEKFITVDVYLVRTHQLVNKNSVAVLYHANYKFKCENFGLRLL